MDYSNVMDTAVITAFNQFARQSWVLDQALAFLSINKLVKGGVLISLLWCAWFRPEPASRKREHVFATLVACVIALALARISLMLLPFRNRPLHDESIDFVLPYGVAEGALDGLSSFPSDHAVLFFCLATGLFFASRALGWFALIYTAIFIALPRIYLGLHFPTDILAGAALGVSVAVVCNMSLPGMRVTNSAMRAFHAWPQFAYPLLFLTTFQIVDLFESSRSALSGLSKLL
jgi:undecaprenyl-diphosphatase